MIQLRLGSGIRTIGPRVVPTTTDVAVLSFEAVFLAVLLEVLDDDDELDLERLSLSSLYLLYLMVLLPSASPNRMFNI